MDLLEELLNAHDRDRCPGAQEVVSLSDQDEPGYLRALERASAERLELSRRGVWHGEYAELDARRDSARADHAHFAVRWREARPIVLPGIAAQLVHAERDELALADQLFGELHEGHALRSFVEQRLEGMDERFQTLPLARPLFDPERDLERVFVESLPPGPRGRKIQDLWLKSGWLSTSEADSSLRLRCSFGREREDDASPDLLRQRLVAQLARAVLPAAEATSTHAPLVAQVERLLGEPPLFTQHIAYWNAPEGGALFHHDAFAEQGGAAGGPGQRGVCYVQLSGATFWLAASTRDLAARVREFVECLAEGELPWVRAQLFADARDWERVRRLCADEAALRLELSLPGCGALAQLVNRGPEFTAFLADAGHAWILRAGDAIVLPNHGLVHTALHSVFCAGEETGYSLSLAIRCDREEPENMQDIETPTRTGSSSGAQ